MWTILLVALLIAFLALLFVPADLSLEMERRRTFNVKLGFRWLFIHVQRELATTRPKKAKTKQKRRGSSIPLRTLTAVGKVPGLWTGTRRFVRRLARSVRVLGIEARMRVGTGDPADTGRLWALVGPAVLWFNRRSWVDVGVEPDFCRACLTGTLEGTVRLYPARLAYSVGSVVFSIMTFRVVLAILRSRPWKH